MARHILTVLTNAVEGRDKEFNDWYSFTHIQEVIGIPGFISAQRFKLTDEQFSGKNQFQYLAIFEIEADDIATALQALKDARSSFIMTDALAAGRELWSYSPITEKITSS